MIVALILVVVVVVGDVVVVIVPVANLLSHQPQFPWMRGLR